jgi:hypothetical protein
VTKPLMDAARRRSGRSEEDTMTQPATILAGRCHIRRRLATHRDGINAPYKRGVS